MKTVEEMGHGVLDVFPLETSEEFLLRLLTDIFENHWSEIRFGTMVQGAVFEIAAPNPPQRISLSDGYLTVDFGPWHFHICIGEYRGSRRKTPVDPALAAHRRTSRAELYRKLNGEGAPTSWGVRLFNGKDEQQMTVFLPNPFLTEDHKIAQTPDWSRLSLWDHLRREYLGLAPDGKDRSAAGFSH